jgi:hypothetical protein
VTGADAKVQREDLVHELAEWIETTFVPASRAARFHRRVRSLARRTGRRREDLMGELNRDARRLLAKLLVR